MSGRQTMIIRASNNWLRVRPQPTSAGCGLTQQSPTTLGSITVRRVTTKCSQLSTSYHLVHPSRPNMVRFPAMASLTPLMTVLWAISILVQMTVLFLVIHKRHFRSLPFFPLYIVLNLCQAAYLLFVYSKFGYTSQEARKIVLDIRANRPSCSSAGRRRGASPYSVGIRRHLGTCMAI